MNSFEDKDKEVVLFKEIDSQEIDGKDSALVEQPKSNDALKITRQTLKQDKKPSTQKEKSKGKKAKVNINTQIEERIRKNLNKDLNLKLLSRRFLESAGYYTMLEANIYKPSYVSAFKHEQVTDIDVLGIRFDVDLTNNVIAVECKSGEENSLDELLKLKGIVDYIDASRGYLMKTRISNNARELGYKLKISTYDQSELESLFISNLPKDKNLAEWIIEERDNYIREKSILEYANMQLPLAVRYLNRDLWNTSDHSNVQNLCTLLGKFKGTDISFRPEMKYLFMQVIIALSIFILKLCGYALSKNLTHAKECFVEAFFGGPKEKRDKEILFDKINQIIASDGRPVSTFVPDYLDRIVDLALLLLKTPIYAKNVVRCLDFYCRTSILNLIGYALDDINQLFSPISLKLAKDIIIASCKLANQNPSIFNDLLLQ